MAEYEVKEGDCMVKIALQHGFYWETLWNHSSNSTLKNTRKDPYVLNPKDNVNIPDKRVTKKENCKPGNKHTFVRKGTTTKFRLHLLEDDKPVKDTPYTLEVDNKFFAGKTDSNGWLEHMIPANAQKGVLLVGPEEDEQGNALAQERYDLNFGHLDSIDSIKGVQARLNNLGFTCGEENGQASEALTEAVKQFQEHYHVTVNGKWDDAMFREKLKKVFEG